MPASVARIDTIPPDKIDPNPDNPRLIFREEQMNELLDSIREVGIKVPLSVYSEGNRFVLIDGERRWKCSLKLNLREVPALVQPKPSRLENILMMFNIHNVRVDWDPLPTAIKLRKVQELLRREGRPSDLHDLAALTGIRVPRLRRLFELLDLPEKYKQLLLREAEKPKDKREVTEDLFLEIYKSLHVIERYTPGVLSQVSPNQFVDSMVQKYRTGAAESVVSFRAISKMARAELAGADPERSAALIVRLVKEPKFSVSHAFEMSVGDAYAVRDLSTRIRGVTDRLESLRSIKELDEGTIELLKLLKKQVDRLVLTLN